MENKRIGDKLTVTTSYGNCYRNENERLLDKDRLKDFTMFEIIFLGEKQEILRKRESIIDVVWVLMDKMDFDGELIVANDPFFVSTNNSGLLEYQVDNKAKYELVFNEFTENFSIASFNYHNNFFGRNFNITNNEGYSHSGCVAFGLERWVYAFLLRYQGKYYPSEFI